MCLNQNGLRITNFEANKQIINFLDVTFNLNLKVYSQWLWIFLSLKSPEEWAIMKQACQDESVVFSYFQYLYITLY